VRAVEAFVEKPNAEIARRGERTNPSTRSAACIAPLISAKFRSSQHPPSGIRAADLVPAGECTVAYSLESSVAGRVVPEQDVVRSGAEEITHANDRIIDMGPADLVPAGKGAVTQGLVPGIAGGAGVGAADMVPAGKSAVIQNLEPGAGANLPEKYPQRLYIKRSSADGAA